jgi:hypothetical protein
MRSAIALLAVWIVLQAPIPLDGQQPDPKVHVIKPTPKTVMWGYYDGASKPVLRIKSGGCSCSDCKVPGHAAS